MKWSLAERFAFLDVTTWHRKMIHFFDIRQDHNISTSQSMLDSIVCVGEWTSYMFNQWQLAWASWQCCSWPTSFIISVKTPYSRRPAKRSSATCSACTAGVQAFRVGLIGHLEKFHINSHQEFLLTKRQKEHLPKHLWCLHNNCLIQKNTSFLYIFNEFVEI